jgi:glycosyltransferase involved in cell wall biosynthesis
MPSLVEGFGLVYLEALSAGCHVIGTTNTGLPDLELPDLAATIIEPGDIERLAVALTELVRAKHNGTLDPVAIQREAQSRTWAGFRQGIASHAARVIEEAQRTMRAPL